MKFYRFMIGIRFNHKAFRLANNMGEIADELLSAKEGSFESITQSREDLERMHLSLFDNDHNSVLTLTNSDIVFKRKSEQGSDISPSLAIREFRDYWKIINKVMRFGTVRRIGLVSEFRVTPPEGVKDISKFLAERLTKIPVPTESKRFRLSYSDRERVEGNSPALINEGIDEFWNSIYNFYPSENDEIPEPSSITLSLDVQRYFNPAVTNPLGSIDDVMARWRLKKEDMLSFARNLEVIDGE